MTKFTFKSEDKCLEGEDIKNISLTMEFETEQLFEIIEQFEQFLKGSGFIIKDRLNLYAE